MEKHGYTPETLAAKTSLPIELINQLIAPCPEEDCSKLLDVVPGVVGFLANIFSCTREDILGYPKPVETLSLNEWATRENIPVTRARDLFDLGLVEGAIHTDFCILIPKDVSAPENSKQLVTLTKRRPRFGTDGWDGFAERLNERMTAANITNIMMADALEVVPTTVSHWRAGIRTPDENKLKIIAKLCKCFVADLLK